MTDIVPLSAIASSEKARLLGEAVEIFFETAHIKVFDLALAKGAFCERWFGRYLDTQPEFFFLALDGGGAAIGYLAGCLDSFSRSARGIIRDIPYYTPAFQKAVATYPSHFHINVKPGYQGHGVGRLLVARFLEACAASGSTGVHVTTGANRAPFTSTRLAGSRRLPFPKPTLALLSWFAPSQYRVKTQQTIEALKRIKGPRALPYCPPSDSISRSLPLSR